MLLIFESDVFICLFLLPELLFKFLHVANSLICLDLSLGSMLEVLVLKNAVECTSQRLKRTSGAQVMTFLL